MTESPYAIPSPERCRKCGMNRYITPGGWRHYNTGSERCYDEVCRCGVDANPCGMHG